MSSNTEITTAGLESYRTVWRASNRRTVADMMETLRQLYDAGEIAWRGVREAGYVIDVVAQSPEAQGRGFTKVWCSYDGGMLVPEDAEVPEDMLTPVPGEHATYTPTAVFLEAVDSRLLRDRAMREARIYLTVDGDNEFYLSYKNMPFLPLFSPGGQRIPDVVKRAVESYTAYTEQLGVAQQTHWLLTSLPETLSVERYTTGDVLVALEGEVDEESIDAAIDAATAAVIHRRQHGESLSWERFTEIVKEAAADFEH